jgi:hypothetical protein
VAPPRKRYTLLKLCPRLIQNLNTSEDRLESTVDFDDGQTEAGHTEHKCQHAETERSRTEHIQTMPNMLREKEATDIIY